jgi:phosphomannomutase / phosphoglucomutase
MADTPAIKDCDIRGRYPDEVSEELLTRAGCNLARALAARTFDGFCSGTVVVGGDGRTSTAPLRAALTSALIEGGASVFDIGGVAPTPALYWARQTFAAQAVAIVTASHSPPDWNGLKVMNGPLPPAPADIVALAADPIPARLAAGRAHHVDGLLDCYIAARTAHVAMTDFRGLRIAVDAGGGCQSGVATKALRELGATVYPIYDEIDPAFRYRNPDCAVPKHLSRLAQEVRDRRADLGIAFDGDGDRLGLIDDLGRWVPAEKVAMLLLAGPVVLAPGQAVVLDVKASMHLESRVAALGGVPVRARSGHAYLKREVIERGAALGAEVSGHFFFGALGGIDDPLHAALVLAARLAGNAAPLSAQLDALPELHLSPDLRLRIGALEIDHVLASLPERFPEARLERTDGVRLVWPEGWLLARRSITEAALTLRFEGADSAALASVQARFVAAYAELRDAVAGAAARS